MACPGSHASWVQPDQPEKNLVPWGGEIRRGEGGPCSPLPSPRPGPWARAQALLSGGQAPVPSLALRCRPLRLLGSPGSVQRGQPRPGPAAGCSCPRFSPQGPEAQCQHRGLRTDGTEARSPPEELRLTCGASLPVLPRPFPGEWAARGSAPTDGKPRPPTGLRAALSSADRPGAPFHTLCRRGHEVTMARARSPLPAPAPAPAGQAVHAAAGAGSCGALSPGRAPDQPHPHPLQALTESWTESSGAHRTMGKLRPGAAEWRGPGHTGR